MTAHSHALSTARAAELRRKLGIARWMLVSARMVIGGSGEADDCTVEDIDRALKESADDGTEWPEAAPVRATNLELSVLRDVVDGRDPYDGKLGGSRRVSQALARCQRKGLLTYKQNREYETIAVVTSAGILALAATLRTGVADG